MALFSKSLFESIIARIKKTPWLAKKDKHSLAFLNATQFLGVLNDNIFKLLVVFLLIDSLGKDKASIILSAAGAIYVVPFLLFSSSAGILADRFSKQKLLVIIKSSEVVIMSLSIVAFAFKSLWGCYTLLFFLATHSAMFGPSKYGIIPELVPKELVSKANGLITSFTYLAIILGTFLGSFVTEMTNRNFILTGVFCLVVALIGLASAFGVKKTSPQGSSKEVNFLFAREIYQTLKFCREIKYLVPAIFGSAYFLFIGAFTQLNIIPFALDSLNLREVAGGYLFLATAVGIAIGSYFCGKWAKKRVELGISCFAGAAIGLNFILLFVFSSYLIPSVIFLVLLGISGGIFIIPFDSFIQINSPVEKRGQVIAAANFLSFTGVLIASISLYVFNQLLHLSSSLGFAVVGIITLVITFILSLRLSDVVFPYYAKKLLFPLLKVRVVNPEILDEGSSLLVLEKATALKAVLATGVVPSLHLLLPKRPRRPFWYKWIRSLDELELENNASVLLEKAKIFLDIYTHPCLVLKGSLDKESLKNSSFLSQLFKRDKVYLIEIVKDEQRRGILIKFSKLSK